ncbi:MAG: aldo/keto reductase, partial [Aeromicrobium sp.]|nr:aldo/keto reductase [Aeromicrobium sp.]
TLVRKLEPIAERHGITVVQLAIAWVAAQGNDIVPVIGMRRRSRLDEAVQAMAVTLDSADLAAIEATVPSGSAAGDRYATEQMAQLDSER